MDKDCFILLRKSEYKGNISEASMHLRTMCSCGGVVSKRSKLFCTVLSFNLLLVLLLIPGHISGKVMSSEKDDLSSTPLTLTSSLSSLSSAQILDSTEDEAPDSDSFAYVDDDPVRFVNEDFVYEDEINHHHNNLYQQSLRGGNTRIGLQQEKCPPLPEPSAVANSRLCEAKICQTDDDCSRDDSLVCCYNGCIHSCLPKVNPPVAFDWVEETELKKFSKEENADESISPRTLLAAELRPESVSLPGGCHLESEQYQDLIMFRKLNHVKTCTCTQGEVLCEVLHEELDS